MPADAPVTSPAPPVSAPVERIRLIDFLRSEPRLHKRPELIAAFRRVAQGRGLLVAPAAVFTQALDAFLLS